MLNQPDFWEKDTDAPLLIQDKGFLRSQDKRIFGRVARWLTYLDIDQNRRIRHDPIKMVLRPARIVLRDAERTFSSDYNRQLLIKILTMARKSFGDYQQTMGYVGAFFLLFFEPPMVLEMLNALNNDPKYIPGYWKAEAVAQANDSWALLDLIRQRDPKLYTHTVENLTCYPDTYCQKWFGGLCIQVMPFEYLIHFFDGFLEFGYRYLIKFGLSVFHNLREEILDIRDVQQLYALLRFDKRAKIIVRGERFRFSDDIFARILADARADSTVPMTDISGVNFAELRENAYAEHLRRRMLAAAQALVDRDYYEQDDITFTDEESDVENEQPK